MVGLKRPLIRRRNRGRPALASADLDSKIADVIERQGRVAGVASARSQAGSALAKEPSARLAALAQRLMEESEQARRQLEAEITDRAGQTREELRRHAAAEADERKRSVSEWLDAEGSRAAERAARKLEKHSRGLTKQNERQVRSIEKRIERRLAAGIEESVGRAVELRLVGERDRLRAETSAEIDRRLGDAERRVSERVTAQSAKKLGREASRLMRQTERQQRKLQRQLESRMDARVDARADALRNEAARAAEATERQMLETTTTRLAERIAELRTELGADLARHAGAVEASVAERAERVEQQSAETHAALARHAAALEHGLEQAREDVERLVAATRADVASHADGLERALAERAEELDREIRREADSRLDAATREAHDRLTRFLDERAESLSEWLGSRVAEEAASLREEVDRQLEATRSESAGVHERASRVLAESEALGEQLLNLSEQLQERTAEAGPPPSAPAEGPLRRRRTKGRVDLNEATNDQLRALGLSVTQARRLLAARESLGGFASLDQLDEIPGLSRGLRASLRRELALGRSRREHANSGAAAVADGGA